MTAVRSFNHCLYRQKSHQVISATDKSQYSNWHVCMSVILNHKIISYKGIIVKVSKLNHDTLFIYFLVGLALCLHLFHSIQYGGKISNTSMKLTWSDFWWMSSTYLFLGQFCQFSEGFLKFLSEAGDPIHSYSSCTHIGALKTECKCKISQKSAYLYNPTGERFNF